jgi:hypothetical protein
MPAIVLINKMFHTNTGTGMQDQPFKQLKYRMEYSLDASVKLLIKRQSVRRKRG